MEKEKHCSNTNCMRPAKFNRKLCEQCGSSILASSKRRQSKLRSEGRCIACSRPSTKLRCEECSLKAALRRLTNADDSASLIQMLEEQENRCAYTGLPISLSKNASIDHKKPKSKGGTNDLENLHWVHSGVNRMKGTMDHEEFIVFIAELHESLKSLFI
jgi:5-methylcytosine-specific restriction endonuclease McrA